MIQICYKNFTIYNIDSTLEHTVSNVVLYMTVQSIILVIGVQIANS